ncbi:uncharacterized protein LOC114722816 isoform X2 [Neltuma alba]|uniref:uncharacterized protein LOC114722816 isoform X2 n=1 Tax=Neltuma alba TaxID=207710 RepID=UPI0010A5A08D|nr:uncharacterized protein LOC114722816 isoform X2 [Prosopis alba]
MNSAIHLYQSPLPVAPGRHSSASKAHARLSHGSLSVSQGSDRRSYLVSSPLHMNSRLHGFSEWSQLMNEEIGKKNNIVRGERGASPAMACVLGAFSLHGKMNHKPILACAGQRSDATEGSPVAGHLKELMLMTTPPKDRFFEEEPDENQIEALKLYTMALSKDKPKLAADILRKEQAQWASGEAGDPLLMALVELLLYQEDYDEASKKIKDLREAVKEDTQPEGPEDPEDPFASTPTSTKWKKFYLLKAIVESVNEARRKAQEEEEDEDGDDDNDTGKAKEALWLIYCRKLGSPGLPGPTGIHM